MGTTSSEEIGIRKDRSVQSNMQYGIVSEGFYGKLWILPQTNQTDWNQKMGEKLPIFFLLQSISMAIQ